MKKKIGTIAKTKDLKLYTTSQKTKITKRFYNLPKKKTRSECKEINKVVDILAT
jgi:hypothetical protein